MNRRKQRKPKRQTKGGKSSPSTAPPQAKVDQVAGWLPTPGAVREVIESVAVALILAFLFRTFEAEAFVIPTGSMAPTLLGRHKEVTCEKCGYKFEVSASEEVDDRTGRLRRQEDWIKGAVCPMCGYAMQWSARSKENHAMKGDRILVGKFVYQLGEPERWDVVVFKFPGEASTNFIKRLVGLPGETVRIQHGDVFVKGPGETDFHIARKPPHKIRAVLQPVFDNDLSPAIEAAGFPPRWRPLEDRGIWRRSTDGKSFVAEGDEEVEAWLRYEHRMPDPGLWRRIAEGEPLPEGEPQARLIADTAAYNTGLRRGDLNTLKYLPYESERFRHLLGLHWVGDLALECMLDVKQPAGELVLELVEGGRRFQCRIDLAQAQARLGISGRDMSDFQPTARLPLKAPGRYRLLFANCDDQLVLWLDDEPVSFDAPTTYDDLGNHVPTTLDLSPVGIACRGAHVEVSGLKIYRDLYYIATTYSSGNDLQSDYKTPRPPDLANPATWYVFRNYMRRVEFPLGPDQFLVLGDNSPKSKDSRIFFWPDTKYKIRVPGTGFSLPYFPNFKEMGFVR